MRLRPTARGRKPLAKLDKAQRISAEEALLRFLNNPRAPGLHFEKLKGHSDLHTIRINRKLRLPSGDRRSRLIRDRRCRAA